MIAEPVAVVLDIETCAEHDRLLCIGWGDTAVTPLSSGEWPASLLSDLASDAITKVVFTKYDHRWLREHGFDVGGPIHDVQTMAWCYNERTELSLARCAELYLPPGTRKDERIVGHTFFRTDAGDEVHVCDAPLDQLQAYNENDLKITRSLYDALRRRLEATDSWDYWRRMHAAFTPVLLEMELRGLPLDTDAAKELRARLITEAERMRRELLGSGGLPEQFNLSSNNQLRKYLFTRGEFELPVRIRLSPEGIEAVNRGEWPEELDSGLIVERVGRVYVHGRFRIKGRGLRPRDKAPKCRAGACGHAEGKCLPSVSAPTLKRWHHSDPWVTDYLKWRQWDKATQFLDTWLAEARNGRIYTHFNQTGTATGRLSSSDPINFQNVPARGTLGRQLRDLFIPVSGTAFVHGDFSQIEPRLMAHFSNDAQMQRVFRSGKDIYEETTVLVLGGRYPKGTPERRLIQICFLAQSYGASAERLQAILAGDGIHYSIKRVRQVLGDIQDLYSDFQTWKMETILDAKSRGFVTTLAGHRRHLTFDYQNSAVWKAERQAVNSIIQGSAADIVQATMMTIHEQQPWLRMLVQVHDELLCETDELEDYAPVLGQFQWAAERGHGFELCVPLVFEPRVIKTWGDAK